MKCEESKRLIHLIDELSDKDRVEVNKHIQGCKECAELFEEVQMMQSVVNRAAKFRSEPSDPVRLTNKIMAQIGNENQATYNLLDIILSYFETPQVKWALSGVSILLIAVFASQFSQNDIYNLAEHKHPGDSVILNVRSFQAQLTEHKASMKSAAMFNCKDPFKISSDCIKEKLSRLRHINKKR